MATITVPCTLCGKPTLMLGTKLCDSCWEISRRIESEPSKAIKVLESLGYKVEKNEA
jgi:hypothetical protein